MLPCKNDLSKEISSIETQSCIKHKRDLFLNVRSPCPYINNKILQPLHSFPFKQEEEKEKLYNIHKNWQQKMGYVHAYKDL